MSDSEPEDRVLHQTHLIGSGAYADVYAATDDASGAVVAYKKARTSARVRRPPLQHEARVLQLLQGHRAVPALIGYERAPHFEHIAMEMLGDHLGQLVEDGHAVNPITVLRVGEQMISALQHIHAHNIIHRDVKLSNILVALDDPSRICLIDYGLARRLSAEEMTSPPTKRYDPLESDKCIIGSVDWCSLNAHEGIDLRPRDDIESLAYTLFFLVLGRLPWRIDYRREPTTEQYPRVQVAKKAFTAALPLPDVPAPLTDLLRAAHASKGNDDMAASLQSVCESFRSDIKQYSEQNNPTLDWTPAPIPASAPPLMPFERKDRPDRPVRARKRERGSDEYSDSYRGRWYLEMVPLPGRAHSLTFPEDEAAMLDALISDELYVSD